MVHIPSTSKSTKPLQLRGFNKENKNKPFKNTKQITYGRAIEINSSIENKSKECSLENDLWKDSFDRLLESGSRMPRKGSAKHVRASFNQDSSIELSIPKENPHKNQEINIKNKTSKFDERSPFNLEKSLAAIKHKMKKPKAKRKNKNNKPVKSIEHSILKRKSIASTPMRRKKKQNLLNTCGISPIKTSKIIPITVYENGILNYTDSIEEARNLTEMNLFNIQNYTNSYKNHEEFKKIENCTLAKFNQAGLEQNDCRIKYVLSYLNKLPSYYEKYCILDETNCNNNINVTLNKTSSILSLNESIHSRFDNNNSFCDESLLKICDKICSNNQMPECNESVRRIEEPNDCAEIISINSTVPNQKSLNSIEVITRNNDNICLNTENELILCSEMPANKNLVSGKGKIEGSKIMNKSNELFEDSHDFKRHQINENRLNNNTDISNKESQNSSRTDLEISKKIMDNIQNINNNNGNSIDNINNFSSQISTKLDNQETILTENNSAFAKRLIFFRNCEILNNKNRSKTPDCSDQNKNNKMFTRHTTKPKKIKSQTNQENQKTSKIILQNNSDESNEQNSNPENIYKKNTNNNSYLNIINRDDKITLRSYKKRDLECRHITRRRPFTTNYNTNDKVSATYCNNSKSYNEKLESEQQKDIQSSINNDNLNNELRQRLKSANLINNEIISPMISDENYEIVPGPQLELVKPRLISQKLPSTSTRILENSLVENNNVINLSDKNVNKRRLTKNRKILAKSSLDDNISNKHEKISFGEKQSDVRIDRNPTGTVGSDEYCEIIPATPMITLKRNPRTRKFRITSEPVANCTRSKSRVRAKSLTITRNTNQKQSKISAAKEKLTLNYPKDNCKVILKKIKNSRVQTTPDTIGSDRDNDIIPGTPLTFVNSIKDLTRKRILLNTSTKNVEKSLDKHNIKNLSEENNNMSLTELEIFETSQSKVNTNKELIRNKNRMPSETITSDEDCKFISDTPLVLKRNLKTRKNRNLASENEIINLKKATSEISTLLGNRKRGKSLLNDNNLPTKQKKISLEDNRPSVNNQIGNLKSKKCKKTLSQQKQTHNLSTNNPNENFKLKNCKIILKRHNLQSHFQRKPEFKETIDNSHGFNQITLTESNHDNNEISQENSTSNKTSFKKSNLKISETAKKSVCFSNIINISPRLSKLNVDSSKSRKNSTPSSIKCNSINSTENNCSFTIDSTKNNTEIENFTETILTTGKLTLSSGKWRRSLINWKRNQSVIEIDESQIVLLNKSAKINLERTITENKYKLMPKKSSAFTQNIIISDQLNDKELKTQRTLRNNARRKTCLDSSLIIVPEIDAAECKSVEKKQTGVRRTLLLEPTDDGTPNYTTCSLFNTFAKPKAAETTGFVSNRKQSKTSKRFIEIEEEDFNDLQQKDDQQQQQQQKQYHHREEYSDERRCNSTITYKNNNNKQKYQHQLSLPICGAKQQQQQQKSPIVSTIQRSTRRGRTSIIETTNNIGFEQLSSSSAFIGSGDYHHSDSEFINSLLLNDDEQNILLCPSLNVSIRALLSPRDIVLRRCGQTDPYDFSIIYSETELRQCRKIGEGVYGEVYMNKNRNGDAVVLKIIPIDGQIEVNGEQQKNFDQILPEIIIAAELSGLRNDTNFMTSGFVEVKNVHCVQGRYPQHLIDLWELYRDNCGTENDNPEIFQDDQLYIVLELANGGQDLEAYQFQNALQSYSAFVQTALSLAVAERKFKFEHRDLHWGNILLAPTDEKDLNFKFNDKIITVPTHGVKATIIDYTLSRMNFEGCCLYNDLSNDNELFTASGDYQFDIYRIMQKNLGNQWERYDPYTNILWLHYTIDKMISGVRYRSSKTKKHRSAIQDMMDLRDELLDYKSASDYVECLD